MNQDLVNIALVMTIGWLFLKIWYEFALLYFTFKQLYYAQKLQKKINAVDIASSSDDVYTGNWN